jgi:hypothetical protein
MRTTAADYMRTEGISPADCIREIIPEAEALTPYRARWRDRWDNHAEPFPGAPVYLELGGDRLAFALELGLQAADACGEDSGAAEEAGAARSAVTDYARAVWVADAVAQELEESTDETFALCTAPHRIVTRWGVFPAQMVASAIWDRYPDEPSRPAAILFELLEHTHSYAVSARLRMDAQDTAEFLARYSSEGCGWLSDAESLLSSAAGDVDRILDIIDEEERRIIWRAASRLRFLHAPTVYDALCRIADRLTQPEEVGA